MGANAAALNVAGGAACAAPWPYSNPAVVAPMTAALADAHVTNFWQATTLLF